AEEVLAVAGERSDDLGPRLEEGLSVVGGDHDHGSIVEMVSMGLAQDRAGRLVDARDGAIVERANLTNVVAARRDAERQTHRLSVLEGASVRGVRPAAIEGIGSGVREVRGRE